MICLIIYTTQYREGGKDFERAAKYLANQKKEEYKVRIEATENKLAVKRIINGILNKGEEIAEFHFIGHSGMYGPMFGTVAYPEQFSPFEWREFKIPFLEGAKAFFHCCRSARWFAPFFSRTFNIIAGGYHWYTTLSKSNKKYKALDAKSKEAYVIGCRGRKSHGYLVSAKKRLGLEAAEEMKFFSPESTNNKESYDRVAELYHNVFTDIKVRKDEWDFIQSKVPVGTEVLLDIGCGNGALLREFADQINKGIGLDASSGMIEQAKKYNAELKNLEFHQNKKPILPIADDSVDCAISMLSFRYLDWDPLMNELKRVLKKDGTVIIVDMVTVPAKTNEYPRLLKNKLKERRTKKSKPEYRLALDKLVSNSDWKEMLKYNPIRAEHEMKWYLESRFPGQKCETINIGYHSRVLAFSAKISQMEEIKLSYP